jgi:preprotein translocase subunit SecA
MLKGLFGGKESAARRGEDSVWMTRAARIDGIAREVAALAEADRSVVAVALTLPALDELERALSAHQPARCADVFAKESLRANLARGGTVTVALSGALPLDVKPGADTGIDVVVHGRNATRAADEAIERFADALGANAHITFHLSLEDSLLEQFGATLQPILKKLGMKPDEPIAHAMVTRAIANAQRKAGG